MKKNKKYAFLAWGLSLAMAMTLIAVPGNASAAGKVRLNKKKATIYVGKKLKLKVKGSKKKVTWKSSNKKIASVSRKGVVQGKKKGTVKITAKVGGKKLICKVKVASKSSSSNSSATTTSKPTTTLKPGTTLKPSTTLKPGTTPTPKPGATASTKPTATKDPNSTSKPTESSLPGETEEPVEEDASYRVLVQLNGGSMDVTDDMQSEQNWYAYDIDEELVSISLYASSMLKLPTPQKAGATFEGWTATDSDGNNIDSFNLQTIDFPVGATMASYDYIIFSANWKQQQIVPVPINYTKDILTVDQYKTALGMTVEEVKEANGEPVRIDSAPQGYSVYVYNMSSDYSKYYHVYVKDDKVVGMATMAKDFSYQYTDDEADTVSWGSAQTSDFSKTNVSIYQYSGQYVYNQGDAYVLVNVSSDTKNIYAIQVMAKSLNSNMQNLLVPDKMQGNYTEDICNSIAKELPEWVNAYRAANGVKMAELMNGATSAQQEAQLRSQGNQTQDLMSAYKSQYNGVSAILECESEGNADAFGTVLYQLDQNCTKCDINKGYMLYAATTNDPVYVNGGFTVNGKKTYAVIHICHF